MADQASKDAAAKERIISHMNADHHDSVVRYLEHYFGVSSWRAYGGKISDVSLFELTLQCAGETYRKPLEPAMTSYREARERLVEMDKECVSALSRSDITVKEFIPPYGFYLYMFILISVVFVAFSRRSHFAPGGAIAKFIPQAFARFNYAIQPYLIWFMLVIHTGEMVHFVRTRLTKHNVNVRSIVWWQWAGTTFIEGFGSFNRFDKMIGRKKVEKERQKH